MSHKAVFALLISVKPRFRKNTPKIPHTPTNTVSDRRENLRSYKTNAALSAWITQALDSTGTLIEGSKTGAEVGRIATVCR